jgi:hypothetical protein
MDFLNKTYKNRITGDTFTIIDVYQNVAITSNKEKINTVLLNNDKLFIPVNGFMNESVSRNPLKEDVIEPSKFFDNQGTYNVFAEKIKSLPLDNIPYDNSMSSKIDNNNFPNNNESAIIMSDPEDEIAELKRKYGASSVDSSVKRQIDTFDKILNPEKKNTDEENSVVQNIEVSREMSNEVKREDLEPMVQRIEIQDPIISMFKNVKRNLDFKINLKIDGKIPRLDFIEMMEDSYDVSMIEYLAEEFTNNLLIDPSLIRNKIIDEIKSMIDKKNGVTKTEDRKIPEVEKEEREVLNEGLPTPVKSKRKPVAKKPEFTEIIKPLPPPTQIIQEGKDPEAEKKKTIKSSTRRAQYKKNTQEL